MTELRRPRCECCDEVLEELLGMRQNFEKFFHRFNSQIVELRRELRALVGKPEVEEGRQTIVSNASNATPVVIKRKLPATARLDSPWSRGGGSDDGTAANQPSTLRSNSHQRAYPQQNVAKQVKLNPATNQATQVKKIETTPKVSSVVKSNAKRPVLDFFGIQLRVMPTCPFNSDVEFEQWETLLLADEDQRDHLRVELMQGHFNDAEKYIKHIWSSVLADNAAQCYSYRGNAKTDKKAVKDMTFTSIFKECFLQRYEHHDTFFFVERTMRFFNYSHDRQRRISKVSQNTFEKVQFAENDDDDVDGEQSMDDDSLMNSLQNGDEEEEDCIYTEST